MAYNPYVYEKLVAERHADLLHDMQQSRMLAHTGRHTFAQNIMSGINGLLAKRTSQLARTGQQSRAYLQEG